MSKTVKTWSSVLALSLFAVAAGPKLVESAELKVLVPNNLRPGMTAAIPKFEAKSGHKVRADFGGSGKLIKQIQGGGKADVVILRTSQISKLKKAGKLASSPTPVVAKVGIGVAVRKGALRPNVMTVDTMKAALRKAKSVGHSDPKVGFLGKHLDKSFTKLGLLGEIKGKRKTFPPGQSLWNAVAAGEVDLAMGPISAIFARKDLDFVGPVPKEMQSYNQFAAGIPISTSNARAAAEFIDFLLSVPAKEILRSKGLTAQ